MSEKVGEDLPFRVIAIVQDREAAERTIEVCRDTPEVGVGLMVRDPKHHSNIARQLAESLLTLNLPPNLFLITNSCSVEEIGWRHLTSVELQSVELQSVELQSGELQSGELQSGELQSGEKSAKLFGASVHSHQEAQLAEERGASYITCSPIFLTESKPESKPLGLLGLRRYVDTVSIPVFALGGITTVERVRECLAVGCWGVAGISFTGNNQLLREILTIFT